MCNTGGGSGLPLLPSGRSAERMRGDEGAARHNFCASPPLIRPCGPPSPRWGEEGAPFVPLTIHMPLSCLEGVTSPRTITPPEIPHELG